MLFYAKGMVFFNIQAWNMAVLWKNDYFCGCFIVLRGKRMTQGTTMTVREYEQLFKQNFERLYYHSLDIVHNEDVARDVVSDVFVNVWRLRDKVAMDTALSYLYTSVRNRSLDQLRHRSRHVPLIEEVIQELEHYSDTDWEEYEARIDAIKAELNRQPERVRRVLYLRFYEQKSNQEVADQMGITVDGVKKIVQRSFAQMRVSLGKKMLKFVPLLLLACMN